MAKSNTSPTPRSGFLLAPSLLSANFAHVVADVVAVEEAGCTYLHLDVMDGHFVPNITFGPVLIDAIRPYSSLIFDTHLMISEPWKYVEAFAAAGSDCITVHVEVFRDVEHLRETLQLIRQQGKQAGVSLNPDTSFERVRPVLGEIDLLLVMSVFPGFGGQAFIPSALDTLVQAREALDRLDHPVVLSVDGGIKQDNVQTVLDAGVELVVAGSAIFKHPQGIHAACREFFGGNPRQLPNPIS